MQGCIDKACRQEVSNILAETVTTLYSYVSKQKGMSKCTRHSGDQEPTGPVQGTNIFIQ